MSAENQPERCDYRISPVPTSEWIQCAREDGHEGEHVFVRPVEAPGCPATCAGLRCSLPGGHAGVHASEGTVRWGDGDGDTAERAAFEAGRERERERIMALLREQVCAEGSKASAARQRASEAEQARRAALEEAERHEARRQQTVDLHVMLKRGG